MSELNERGQRIAEALAHVPERWREAAMNWLERTGAERDQEVLALFGDRRFKKLWADVDEAANVQPGRLRVAYRAIISVLLDPPSVPEETRGALLKRRKGMAQNLRRVAHDLARDPAANASLADVFELSGWTLPAGDLQASDPSAARGSAVPALRDLAHALECGAAISATDREIIGAKPRRDENAIQREFESMLCDWLRRATGWPFDHFIVVAVAFALDVETSASEISARRTARASRRN